MTGEATIYVSGDVNISGNGIGTASNLPPNLIINVEGAHNVSVSGDGDFYGKIYAPESSISVSGNGDLYGALIGDTFSDEINSLFNKLGNDTDYLLVDMPFKPGVATGTLLKNADLSKFIL